MNTEDQTTTNAATDNTAGAAAPSTTSSELTIRSQVRERLASVGDRTREQVIEHFAQQEADKQARAIISGLDKLDGLERDLRKVKPQVTGFDADGAPVGEPTFTKEQVEERKKLGQQIEKLTNAINKADDRGDFGDLYNLAK